MTTRTSLKNIPRDFSFHHPQNGLISWLACLNFYHIACRLRQIDSIILIIVIKTTLKRRFTRAHAVLHVLYEPHALQFSTDGISVCDFVVPKPLSLLDKKKPWDLTKNANRPAHPWKRGNCGFMSEKSQKTLQNFVRFLYFFSVLQNKFRQIPCFFCFLFFNNDKMIVGFTVELCVVRSAPRTAT